MEEIAQVYARSLFEIAKQDGELDRVRDEIGQFADAVDGSRELQAFYFSPYFSTEEKREGLKAMVEGASGTVMRFLELLIENHRMPVIFRIRRELERLWRQENKLLPVQITSAVALDPSVVDKIGAEIGRQTGQTIELKAEVDPDVLGGIVLRVGNSILDASIRNRLEQLRKNVATAA